MPPSITIRRASTIADYQACQRAQRAAWGIADDSYIVPVATMIGAQHHGGLVLGAFLPDGEALGMSFAFLGRTEGRICLYSQLTGVVPGHQDQGIGYRLKTAQRDVARVENVPCIAWAFDPLQSGNARFNLDKLGATCDRYIVDMYGPRSDALNRDTPTDRLIAIWETDPRIKPTTIDPARWETIFRLIESDPTSGAPVESPIPAGATELLLEIPNDIARLRAEQPDTAARWVLAVRRAFTGAFDSGFRAEGFARLNHPQGRRGFYRLVRVPRDPNGSSVQAR